MNEYLELISLDIWHIAAAILNLLILTLVFKKFLFKPVMNILEKRQGEVDNIYRKAEETESLAERDRQLYEEKLAGAKSEADGIIKAATARADRLSDEIIENAKIKADETMKKAENEIERERKKARNELKNEISGISVQIAESIVKREIREDDHRELIDSFIEEL